MPYPGTRFRDILHDPLHLFENRKCRGKMQRRIIDCRSQLLENGRRDTPVHAYARPSVYETVTYALRQPPTALVETF